MRGEGLPGFRPVHLFHEFEEKSARASKTGRGANGRQRRSACTAYYTNGREDGQIRPFIPRWYTIRTGGAALENHDGHQIYGPAVCCGRIPEAQVVVAEIA